MVWWSPLPDLLLGGCDHPCKKRSLHGDRPSSSSSSSPSSSSSAASSSGGPSASSSTGPSTSTANSAPGGGPGSRGRTGPPTDKSHVGVNAPSPRKGGWIWGFKWHNRRVQLGRWEARGAQILPIRTSQILPIRASLGTKPLPKRQTPQIIDLRRIF